MDQPLPTPNAVLHNYMATNIERDGFKVVLNGVGGDEFLWISVTFVSTKLFKKKKKNSKRTFTTG